MLLYQLNIQWIKYSVEFLAIPSELDSGVLAAETTSELDSAGTWRFCALVREEEWNPSVFTSVLENCAPKSGQILNVASIFLMHALQRLFFSYACIQNQIPDLQIKIHQMASLQCWTPGPLH